MRCETNVEGFFWNVGSGTSVELAPFAQCLKIDLPGSGGRALISYTDERTQNCPASVCSILGVSREKLVADSLVVRFGSALPRKSCELRGSRGPRPIAKHVWTSRSVPILPFDCRRGILACGLGRELCGPCNAPSKEHLDSQGHFVRRRFSLLALW